MGTSSADGTPLEITASRIDTPLLLHLQELYDTETWSEDGIIHIKLFRKIWK